MVVARTFVLFVFVATAAATVNLNSFTTEDTLALLKEWDIDHAFAEVGYLISRLG